MITVGRFFFLLIAGKRHFPKFFKIIEVRSRSGINHSGFTTLVSCMILPDDAEFQLIVATGLDDRRIAHIHRGLVHITEHDKIIV